jgi:hypothetical protein
MQSETGLRKWLILCLYVAGFGIGGVLLIQHWVHLPALLPYVFFLACPLMHLFMHRGHRHAERTDHHTSSEEETA